MVMDLFTYSKEKKQRMRHSSAQSFPDGTDRSHYLCRLCSGSQGNAALFHNRCFNDPNLSCSLSYPGPWLAQNLKKMELPGGRLHYWYTDVVSPSWEDKLRIACLPPDGFPYDIQSPSGVRFMQRIVSISITRSPPFTRELRYELWDSLPVCSQCGYG